MYLIAAATEMELAPLRSLETKFGIDLLATGFGPVQTGISLTRYFEKNETEGLILFGLGGGYAGQNIDVLDLCVAASEVYGDLGIAFGNKIEYFQEELCGKVYFNLENALSETVCTALNNLTTPFRKGPFVTVNCCSGTRSRAEFLAGRFNALCENMEGAAAARACDIYGVNLLEIRCISNLVDNYDKSKWKLTEAIAKMAETMKSVLTEIKK